MPKSAAKPRSKSGSPGRAAEPAVALLVSCERWTEAGCAPVAERAALAALDDHRRRAAEADFSAAELSLELADDARMAALNRAHRGRNGPTNVLSFPALEPDALEGALSRRRGGRGEPPLLLGDVILAYETTAREAREQGKRLADHLAHLVVHGTLHCLGYDHAHEDEAEEMETAERRILARLGIADPYAYACVETKNGGRE